MHDRLYIMVRGRDCDGVWGTSLHRIYRKNLQRLWYRLQETAEGQTHIEYLTEQQFNDIVNQLNEENDQ
jgi:hypothetical protein